MNTTEPTKPAPAYEHPSFAEELPEFLPLGRLLVAVPFVVLILMLSGPFLLLVTIVVVLGLVAMLIGLTGAILATPYLVVRHLQRRAADRREPEASPASDVAALELATLGGSR